MTVIAALTSTIFTNHQFGLVKIVRNKLHLAVDFMVGVVFGAAPFVLGFAGLGVTVLLVVTPDHTREEAFAI